MSKVTELPEELTELPHRRLSLQLVLPPKVCPVINDIESQAEAGQSQGVRGGMRSDCTQPGPALWALEELRAVWI